MLTHLGKEEEKEGRMMRRKMEEEQRQKQEQDQVEQEEEQEEEEEIYDVLPLRCAVVDPVEIDYGLALEVGYRWWGLPSLMLLLW